MKNKKLFNAIVKISLLSTILAMSFQVLPTNAAALLTMSDTMTRLMTGIASDHAIKFTTPTGAAVGNTIIATFSADFVMGTVDYTDVTVKDDTVALTDAADCTGTEDLGIAVGANAVTITVCTEYVAGINANSVVDILVGLNATGGNAQITNGAADDDDNIAITGTFGDTGTIIVDIIANDRVVITATIDPFFTFVIEQNTCGLGNLSDLAVHECDYDLSVGTNATQGAVITIQAIDTGDGQTKLHGVAVPANNIDDIGEATVSAGVEGYGIEVFAGVGAGWTAQGLFSSDDSSVPSALTSILSTPGPIAVGVVNTITHRASASTTTSAGAYIQTVQYIATGTF